MDRLNKYFILKAHLKRLREQLFLLAGKYTSLDVVVSVMEISRERRPPVGNAFQRCYLKPSDYGGEEKKKRNTCVRPRYWSHATRDTRLRAARITFRFLGMTFRWHVFSAVCFRGLGRIHLIWRHTTNLIKVSNDNGGWHVVNGGYSTEL